jgi:pimeloyl-ACP methyl ester carboxylesterase
MADQVAAELAAAAHGGRYAVVGHSMGGKVAMALALLHPELVERLCVVDVSPVPTTAVSGFGAYVAGMRTIDIEHLPDRATADLHLQPYAPDPVIRGFLLQNLRRDGDRWRWQMNLDLLGDELDTIGGWPDLTAQPYRAGPYPGPVLWVGGSRSDYVRPEHAPAMRALFPRVRTVMVKEAGHWVHADQPEVFASLVRRFLQL